MRAPYVSCLHQEHTIPVRLVQASARSLSTILIGVGLFLLSACTGDLGGAGSPGNGDGDAPGSDGDQDPDQLPLVDGVSATDLRRLGKLEIQNSVRDFLPALPASFDPAADIPVDNHVELAFSLPGTVSELEVKRFSDMAEEAIASLGTASPGNTNTCGADETTCAQATITELATRAFRRPPLPEEMNDLWALFQALRTDPEMGFSVAESLDGVVEALLQSPGFLYRWERGPQAPAIEGDKVKYDSYEMASRLSYFLWNSSPDAALLEVAKSGGLVTPDQIETETRRMMADPRFDRALRDFVAQWLELHELPTIVKDSGVYPNFQSGLGSAMLEETEVFMRDVFRSSDPTLRHLLTRETTHVSPELGAYYGVTVEEDGRADLAGTSRRGILLLGGMLTAKGNSYRTSPVRRGKLMLNRFLCDNVPPPPPDVMLDLPPPDPSLTLREQMDLHASSPTCNNCHGVLDPLGLAFEHFDGAGAYRATEGGLPIDASGTLKLKEVDWQFDDADQLITELSSSPAVQDCFAKQWLRYALDRFEQDEESQTVHDIETAHRDADLHLPELIVSIVRSRPFSYRALREGEL